MIFEMLRWWYITGWAQAAHRIVSWTSAVEHMFSLSLLLRTLFAPWKRITSAAGRGLDAKMRAGLDNLLSRCIGFVIRLFVITAALVGMFFAFVSGVVMAVIWPFLPLLFVAFIVKGITG
jgi:hypothetical protein